MTHSTPDALRALFPHLTETQLAAATERLRRYVSVAIAVSESLDCDVLTPEESGGTVKPGSEVEPQHTTTQYDS